MSFEAVNAVLEKSESREAARLVMICIAERADENRQAYPSMADIARRARLNPQVVARIIDRLVESKELIRLYRIGSSASFIVATGLTADELETNARKAWGKTLRQVASANKEAAERMGKSKGNPATHLPNVKGLTHLPKVKGYDESDDGNPFTEDTDTLLPTVDNPFTQSKSEPSITISEPSIGGDAASETNPDMETDHGQSHDLFVFPNASRLQRKIANCKADELTKETLRKFYMLYPALVFDARRDVAGGRALAEIVNGDWPLMDEAATKLTGDYTPSGPYGMVKTCNKLRQQHAPKAATAQPALVAMSDGTLAKPYRP